MIYWKGGLGRKNAPVIYLAASNVSLTTKCSKRSLWVEVGILHFPVSDLVIRSMMYQMPEGPICTSHYQFCSTHSALFPMPELSLGC